MSKAIKGIKKTITALQDDFTSADSRVELLSNKEATIEGCKGIMDYERNYIKLNIGSGTVAFFGKDLYAYSYSGDTVILRGKISSLEFCM